MLLLLICCLYFYVSIVPVSAWIIQRSKMMQGQECEPRGLAAQIQGVMFTGWVTLGKLLNSSVSLFLICKMEITVVSVSEAWALNYFVYIEHLEQCLACSEHSIHISNHCPFAQNLFCKYTAFQTVAFVGLCLCYVIRPVHLFFPRFEFQRKKNQAFKVHLE